MTEDKKKKNSCLIQVLITLGIIIVIVVINIVYKAISNPSPSYSSQEQIGTGELYCSDCAEEDVEIILWSDYTESKTHVGNAPIGSLVNIYEKKYHSTENCYYYNISLLTDPSIKGWLPETLITVLQIEE